MAAQSHRACTSTHVAQPTNLADIILAKIAEKEAFGGSGGEPLAPPGEEDYELPPKVIEVYTQYVRTCNVTTNIEKSLTLLRIGLILSRYKSGPLPKVFKVLPTIPHWEDILMITQPEQWSPNAW